MFPIPALANAEAFSADSRIWVYTANRPLTASETAQVQTELDRFAQQWTAHNQALLACAEVYANQFILLMVDETRAGASGCSIDKSVHFLEQLGDKIGVDFFDRMRFGWIENGNLVTGDRDTCVKLRQNNTISEQTMMLNTLVQTRRALQSTWLQPLSESWHKRLI